MLASCSNTVLERGVDIVDIKSLGPEMMVGSAI